MNDTQDSSHCSSGKSCPFMRCIFAVALIAILTCISWALWDVAAAVEALKPG